MSIVPLGVAHVPTSAAETQRLNFVLAPKLTLMAFTAAIEPLRLANQLAGQALYDWQVLSVDGAPVRCSNGVEIGVDGALTASWPEAPLILCSGGDPLRNIPDALPDALRYHWRRGGIVGGLCTGAYGLARAGLLKGHRFTLHWENLPPFRELYPELDARETLYERDVRIWTCAGGASATDMMLAVIAEDHGTVLAQSVADMMLHPFMRRHAERQRASPATLIGTRNPALLTIINSVEVALNEGCGLGGVQIQNDLSERQVQRLFRKYLGMSPRQYIRQRQLERARALLHETTLSIAEVSCATGFSCPSVMARWFRDTYGQSPYSFRRVRVGELDSPKNNGSRSRAPLT